MIRRWLVLLFLALAGTDSPSVQAQEAGILSEIVEESTQEEVEEIPAPKVSGNLYTNPFYGFSIKLPNEDWQYILDRETIDTFNSEALLVMTAPDLDLYSMVIIEKFPDVSIEDYAELVQPGLESLVRISGENLTLSELPSYRQVWEGTFDQIPMRFHYTLLEKEDYRIQIVSWCAKSNWTAEVESQFHSLGLNYVDLGPVRVLKQPPWTPPLEVSLEDIHTNHRHGFSISRPSASWTFVSDREELSAINPEATLVLHQNEEVFSMVLVERLPDLTLAEYSGKVSPSLEDASILGEEETMIHGLEARRRQWRGKFDGVRFDFLYTLLANGEDRIQIVSWCPTSMVDDNIRAQIRYIEESFTPLNLPLSPIGTESP